MRTLWNKFWSPATGISFGVVVIVSGIAGVVFWGGFNTFMEATNQLDFCISCHEMENTVYQEYKKSVHYSNPSGVRATCPDCHVPKEWVPKLIRKIKASKELYHKFMGSIDTVEKFEAKRYQLAQNVWAEMEANHSHECRNCHSYDAMHWDKQRARAKEKMKEASEKGKTCIECLDLPGISGEAFSLFLP